MQQGTKCTDYGRQKCTDYGRQKCSREVREHGLQGGQRTESAIKIEDSLV